MRLLALLAILAFCLSVPFASWVENLTVSVVGANGLPVQSADVQVSYQQSSMVSEDGLASGKTNESGAFSAALQDFINGTQERRYYYVTASAYGWSSGPVRFEVSGTGSRNAALSSTLRMREVTVLVSDQRGNPIQNVEIFEASPVVSKRRTDSAGRALFTVPEDAKLAVFATYGNETKPGASTPGTQSASAIAFVFQSAVNSLRLTILSPAGEPMPGAKVTLSNGGWQQQYAASGDGSIALEHTSLPYVSATVPYQTAEFTQEFQLSPATVAAFRLPAPLDLGDPAITRAQGTCSAVSFQLASPPRDLSSSLEYRDNVGTARTEMEVSGGTLSAEVCPYSEASAVLYVFWKEGNVSAKQNYSFFIPLPGAQSQPATPPGSAANATKPKSPPLPALDIKIKMEQVLPFCGGVIALLVLSGAIVMREQIIYAFRCAIRYVRKILKF
jgi:hypothetical protein